MALSDTSTTLKAAHEATVDITAGETESNDGREMERVIRQTLKCHKSALNSMFTRQPAELIIVTFIFANFRRPNKVVLVV